MAALDPIRLGAILLGVDGGATRVRALAVRRDERGRLEALGAPVEHGYADPPGFAPVDLDEQRAALLENRAELSAGERAAAAGRVRTVAEALAQAAREAGGGPIRAGLCMPGLKTLDGRGISVLRHGPRMPLFLDDLADELGALGMRLERPLPALAGDGVCGALGELFGVRGSLLGVQNALYLAGGTGLAEAVLLEGRVRALDELPEVRAKAWALEFAPSVTFEDALSAGGWRRAFARAGGAQDVMPEQAALQGDERARAILARAAEALAALCALRRDALRAHGRPVPDCAVVGQRLGRLLERGELAPLLRAPAEAALAARGFSAGFLRASTLDEAPALGAASLAPWDDARGSVARGAPAC